MASGARRILATRPRARLRAALARPHLASSAPGRAPARWERAPPRFSCSRAPPASRAAPRRGRVVRHGQLRPRDGRVRASRDLFAVAEDRGQDRRGGVLGCTEAWWRARRRRSPVSSRRRTSATRGRDWFSFYADERATCRRLKETGCEGVAPFLGVCGSDAYLVWRDVGVVTLESCVARARSAEEAFDAIGDVFRGDADSKPTAEQRGGNEARALVFLRLARSLLTATASMHANERGAPGRQAGERFGFPRSARRSVGGFGRGRRPRRKRQLRPVRDHLRSDVRRARAGGPRQR